MYKIIKNPAKVLISFYLLTSILWFWFFKDSNLNSFDWLGANQVIFNVLEESIQQFRIPYHYAGYDVPIKDFQNGSYAVRWFAMGAGSISPQNILFAFFNSPTSIYLNFFFYLGVGYYGIYIWCRKLNLSTFSILWLTTTWIFNGAFISRWGIGHMAWSNGYLLIPIFIFYVNELIENIENPNILFKTSLKIALLIFVCKLNSNGHIVFQMLLILSFTVVFFSKLIKYFIYILGTSIPLLSFYLFPTIYFSPYMLEGSMYSKREIFGGFGIFFQSSPVDCFSLLKLSNNSDFLNHFLNIVIHIFQSLTKIVSPSCDAAWESSMYIGYFGTFILIVTFFIFLFKNVKFNYKNKKILYLIILIAIFSISIIFRYFSISLSYLYDFPKIDRLPTRLMLYPLFCLILICSVTLNKINNKILNFLKVVFVFQFIEMVIFFKKWILVNVEKSYLPPLFEERLNPYGRLLDYSTDLHYINIVNISFTISTTTFLMIILYLFCKRNLK